MSTHLTLEAAYNQGTYETMYTGVKYKQDQQGVCIYYCWENRQSMRAKAIENQGNNLTTRIPEKYLYSLNEQIKQAFTEFHL